MLKTGMSLSEKFLLLTDILFAVLVFWLFPSKRFVSLVWRLVYVGLIVGINATVLSCNSNDVWVLRHAWIYQVFCIPTTLHVLRGWFRQRRNKSPEKS